MVCSRFDLLCAAVFGVALATTTAGWAISPTEEQSRGSEINISEGFDNQPTEKEDPEDQEEGEDPGSEEKGSEEPAAETKKDAPSQPAANKPSKQPTSVNKEDTDLFDTPLYPQKTRNVRRKSLRAIFGLDRNCSSERWIKNRPHQCDELPES